MWGTFFLIFGKMALVCFVMMCFACLMLVVGDYIAPRDKD